ncbi:MAG: tRNA preQ1(34) S-adenosylmethionine ribosyltransferase-isomerase QueA [Spirochaetia bacterium]|nr:tRNA preQ1(34) S-adenosylmethionine ribosyltransferase-isomerase QueA [Spirochaetia bacterium]
MQRNIHPVIDDYIFHLPDELIAKYPVEPFDHCRLLRVQKIMKKTTDAFFYDLPNFLEAGDLLVVNNSRVEARRIFLKRQTKSKQSGSRIETVFLEKMDNIQGAKNQCWNALIKKKQRLKHLEVLACEADENIFFIVHKLDDGRTYLEESVDMNGEIFGKIGQMPIPPYLKREEANIDRRAYQNPFSKKGDLNAAVAAPTAALHFTPDLLDKLKRAQVRLEPLALNIGYGTFAPLRTENFLMQKLHRESYEIPENLARILGKKEYNRLYAVGTTSLRVLETVHCLTGGRYDNFLKGQTDIFLYPPYNIRSVDGMITNFHLPGSSLIMLVACLAEKNLLMRAYQSAIEKKYRFFSYGDAMLIQK